MASHSEVKHSRSHSVTRRHSYTQSIAHQRQHRGVHGTENRRTNTLSRHLVWGCSVANLLLFVSPAEPPSAPLIWALPSPFLTNLSLVYIPFLLLSGPSNLTDSKEEATCSTAKEAGRRSFKELVFDSLLHHAAACKYAHCMSVQPDLRNDYNFSLILSVDCHNFHKLKLLVCFAQNPTHSWCQWKFEMFACWMTQTIDDLTWVLFNEPGQVRKSNSETETTTNLWCQYFKNTISL